MGDIHLWPVTVLRARYSGVYEGGEWVALKCYPQEVPEDVLGEDLECMSWFEAPTVPLGVGATPSDAVESLRAELRRLDEQRPA